MNTSSDCERIRIALMAALDGENHPDDTLARDHLPTCASCQRWLKDLESLAGRLDGLEYQRSQNDLWLEVEARIRPSEKLPHPRAFWPIAAIVLGWRALELVIDLPMPVLHAFVPLATLVLAVWLIAGDPLAIETSAPELQQGGV